MPFNFKRNVGNPPPTGNLPTFFAGSIYNDSLDTRVRTVVPNPVQPPATGKLPTFPDGKKDTGIGSQVVVQYKNSSNK